MREILPRVLIAWTKLEWKDECWEALARTMTYVGLPMGGSQPPSVCDTQIAQQGPWAPKNWKKEQKRKNLLESKRFNLELQQNGDYTGLFDPCVTAVLGSIWITNLEHECTRKGCPFQPHELDEGAILIGGHKKREIISLLEQLRPFTDGGQDINLGFKALQTLLGRLYGFLQMAVRGLPSFVVFQASLNHMLCNQRAVKGDPATGKLPDVKHAHFKQWQSNWKRVCDGVNSHREPFVHCIM